MSAFAWLIEAPGPHYLSVRKLSLQEFHWTPDPHGALRFWSRDQADGVMMAVRHMAPQLFAFAASLRDARPVEHGWIDPSPTKGDEG